MPFDELRDVVSSKMNALEICAARHQRLAEIVEQMTGVK